MEFDRYQTAAAETAQLDIMTKEGSVELALGLTAEVGALAKGYRALLRDKMSLEAQRPRLMEELGDALWYVAMIARSVGVDLGEVARENIVRVQDRYQRIVASPDAYRPSYEEGYPPTEVFPRRMLFELRPEDMTETGGLPHVSFWIHEASPYAFPDGPICFNGKQAGFELPQRIGDPVNDNAEAEDGYRYHDAVHVAFMAVLGWSPVMRALLRLKRKSKLDVDRNEDGARASDLEEALSACLKQFSKTRNDFRNDADVDGDTRDLVKRLVTDLEVRRAPLWQWSKAIRQGYEATNALRKHGGGWLLADLDAQSVRYSVERPEF